MVVGIGCPRRVGPKACRYEAETKKREFWWNKARMSMKTKQKVKKSRAGADVALERLRCAEGAGRAGCPDSPTLSLRDIADPTRQESGPAWMARLIAEFERTNRECL